MSLYSSVGAIFQETEIQRPIYYAAFTGVASAASCTDLAFIAGSASKYINVLEVWISATATAAVAAPIQLMKRSTLDTGGTLVAAPALVPVNSNYPAAVATVSAYTANPTTGTLTGLMLSAHLGVTVPGGAPTPLIITFMTSGFSPIKLVSATESLCVNLNGATYAGSLFNITFVWSEGAL